MMNNRNFSLIFHTIKPIISMYEITNMLCNIHINWKKSVVSFILDEFNSYFTVGKRGALAVIKDVFTAMEPVDLTEPDKAVKTVVSNIARP